MSRFLFRDRVRDKFQGIGSACVFGDRVIIQINESCDRVKSHVLKDRPKSFGGRVNFRLGRFGKSDHFGVASAFEVEHAIVAPAVLIVPNETAGRVSGKSRFAGAAQTKEQCHIIRILRIYIGRTVHGQYTFKRKQIIQ